MDINIQQALTGEEKLHLLIELLGEVLHDNQKLVDELASKYHNSEKSHFNYHLNINDRISALEKKK